LLKISAIFVLLLTLFSAFAQPINREAVVKRHTVTIKKFDSLASLSLGNGGFAFTADITGLQSFPEAYAKGVPLGTQSEWGWHSFVDTADYRFDETLKKYLFNGKVVSYSVQLKEPDRNKNAVNWFRQNPHRLQLGNIGFEIIKKDGTKAMLEDIKEIHQTLDMFTGRLHSSFKVEGIWVDVLTYCHQQQDLISVKVKSELIKQGRLLITIRFPYPTGEWKDVGINTQYPERHQSTIVNSSFNRAILNHKLDTSNYYVDLAWSPGTNIAERKKHEFIIKADDKKTEFYCSFRFRNQKSSTPPASYEQTKMNSEGDWKKFWYSGAAIDFAGSTDTRANELERRIVLSQYLTKIQCAGNFPPQETGLTYNSWFGKPHLEMHWWHALHFALWGRKEILEKQMKWYSKVSSKAFAIAKRQGYNGLRWQKMTDHAGNESPSSVGAFLIWQQPHIISFAELIYQKTNNKETLSKYKDLVFATADFMASYAYYDTKMNKYILGKGVIAAQERFKAEETYNPAYEIVYWYWALTTAQQWRKRLGLRPDNKWEDVIQKLSPLVVQENKYLFAESATDSYTNPEYKTDHPSVFGALGMLPKTKWVNASVMKNTFDWIWDNWSWKDTWGWDFPLTAMTAARLNMPDKAIDALMMPVQTNTYLPNGHNFQDDRLTIYLPGNGGLLTAIAMMCAGWEGNTIINPGIPKDGKWKVKWEGFQKMY